MYVHKPAVVEKPIKKKSPKDFRTEKRIIQALTVHFEDWPNYFEKNTSYQEPYRRGNFGEIAEISFKLEDNTRKRVSYFGTLSDLDYLLCTK